MKRPAYRDAIDWLAGNDDCYWLGDYDDHGSMISVSAALVRDLWDVSDERLLADLRRALKRIYPNHEALKGARA
jgi:enoyl reductase-like protein